MIIFINGSINAGKSTVSKLLVKELPNTALLEIDALRDMIAWMPMSSAIPINLENAASIARNFSERGLNVVIPYPLSRNDYDYVMGALKGVKTDVYVFTLAPRFSEVLKNRGTRELNAWEIDRIKYHYKIGIHKPDFGEVIDNSEQSPAETAKIILSKLKPGRVS